MRTLHRNITAATIGMAAAIAAVCRADPVTPPPPGVVVDYSPPPSKVYLGSPGIVRLGDGTLLMKCDEFGPASGDQVAGITQVFRSADHGVTWAHAARVVGLYWATLFQHGGALYMVGAHHEYGQLVVVKSTDGGTTWTTPRDGRTGLIRPGKWHTAPVPVIEHAGRLWRAVEDAEGPSGWGRMFRPHVISIPADGDLLDAGQWTVSNPVPRDGGWLGGTFRCVLEGNAVLDRAAGRVRVILRTDNPLLAGVATASEDGRTLSVDPAFDRMPFEGVDKKFEIRWDEPSHLYLALANPTLVGDAAGNGAGNTSESGSYRNTLALYGSPDLHAWTLRCVLLHHPDFAHHAFQYADWTTDGDDLLIASRTAWDSPGGVPGRGHDANFLTFHRFPNFRAITPKDGVQLPELATVSRDVGGLRVAGQGIAFDTLDDGRQAFTNRDYVWADVPPALRGATVTRGPGGFRGTVTAEALGGPGDLWVFTSGPTAGLDLSSFTPVPGMGFRYTDHDRTAVRLYRRPLAAGERVTLPQGNWAGVHVLVRAASK